MASSHRSHCADPHTLLRMEYSKWALHTCDLCESELAGQVGYGCRKCNFDVHEECADYFKETVSFFAHPWHPLKLSRMPSSCVGWACDLCQGPCPPGTFVYRCLGCKFDVHPICTMLPQTIRSPLHPQHDLRMVPSWGSCSSCCEVLPVWHYVCTGSCVFRLHIGCVIGAASEAEQGSTTIGSQSVVRPRRRTRVAKFLLKRAFFMAIDATTGGLGSPVIEILAHAMG